MKKYMKYIQNINNFLNAKYKEKSDKKKINDSLNHILSFIKKRFK